MAAQGPTVKSKTGFGRFPARLKSFVHDMKSFRKDVYRHRQGVRSEELGSKQPLPSEDLIPAAKEDAAVSETRSLFRDSPRVRSLSIRVTVNFGEPLNYAHSQDYEGSSLLQPTEELCEALIRRVDHCSKELITRRDSSALDRTGSDGLAKPLRYEIQLQVLRHEIGTGIEAWASRTLRSYQRQPLGTEAAREVILSTHYMVGLFLRHHDEAFVWKDSPVREDSLQEQKTFPYRPGRVQPLTSIPRSFFVEKQQEFESIPGYTIRFSFTSQNHHRKPHQWHETIEVNSRQLSPLTLANAEDLFLDACYAVDGVFRLQRKEFGALQDSCASHSGCRHCRPQDGDGIEMLVSAKNNVGPLFDNLERTTWASVNVFWKDQATDCIEFVEKAKTAIEQVCRDADESVSRMNDFEFYIIELRGRGWTIDEPLAFTLGPETCLCRRTVETLLDRLQTGVADVLRGNAIAVRMTARKRGHFILHKTLVAREPIEKPGNKKKSSGKPKAYVLDRLKQRIERDIEMVCKDTCTIVNRDIETVKPDRDASAVPQDYSSIHTGLISSRRLSDLTVPSNRPTTNGQDSSTDRLGSRGSELLETPEVSSPVPIPLHIRIRVARDPITGARLFPLVPGRQTYELSNTGSQGSLSRHNKFSRDGTTATSFDLTTSYGPTNTFTTETTSDSSISRREQDYTETSAKESHNNDRERYITEGSTASTRPQTPDLVAGGSPSIRSSVIITPNIREPLLNTEVDEHGKVNNYLSKLHVHRPTSSPTSQLDYQNGPVRSAIDCVQSAPTKQHLDNSSYEDWVTETSSRSGRRIKESSSYKTPNDRVAVEPITEQDGTRTESEGDSAPVPETEPEKEYFSQSKPDYDFSSPPATTPPEENKETTEAEAPSSAEKSNAVTSLTIKQDEAHQSTTSHEPSEEDSSDGKVPGPPPLERPAPTALQHRQAKSFGSAGYLGSFREQRFYGVGLRRALVGSSTPPRPFSRLSFREEDEREWPGTANV
ncbi:hypothetical protein F4802DRAFT_446545 [Xylaria palmicola]|nr:hypothetical protein F4802DRAFT_446545 [Xylaria palmicola]